MRSLCVYLVVLSGLCGACQKSVSAPERSPVETVVRSVEATPVVVPAKPKPSDEVGKGSAQEAVEVRRADGIEPQTDEVKPTSMTRRTEVEGVSGGALDAFFGGLRRLDEKTGEDGEKVRILYYGDSHVAADILTGTVRRLLQDRFGDGGPGFLYPGKVWKSYRCLDVNNGTSRRKDWKTVRGGMGRGSKLDGVFGLGGVTTSSKKKGASVWLEMKDGKGSAGHFDVMYAREPRGGEFEVRLDGGRVGRVKTASKAGGVGVWSHKGDAKKFEVRARSKRSVRLLGMVMERKESGVVLDMLGINGARASTSRVWDVGVWGESVGWRGPKLFVVAYGTNELAAKTSPKRHGKHLRRVVKTLRKAAPQASCLIVGPPDYAVHVSGEGDEAVWEPLEGVGAMVEEQRAVARELGCAFWSTRDAMGGEGSIIPWATHEPPWALYDRIHLTWPGYQAVAEELVAALLRSYDAYILK